MNIHRETTDDTPIELIVSTNLPDVTQLPVQVAYLPANAIAQPGDWIAASWNAAGHVQTAGVATLGLAVGIYEPQLLLNNQPIQASGRVVVHS